MNSLSPAIISCIVGVATGIQAAPMAVVHPLPLAKPALRSDIKKDADSMFKPKTEEQMDQQVKEFFLQYEKTNSSSDVSGIGVLYADTFMFGGPNGVQAVTKADFLKVVPKRKAYLSSMGLSETKLECVEAIPIDSKYLLANVAWKMKLQTSSGSKPLDTYATYILLRGSEDVLSIVFQIDHQDLASVVKHLQSTQK